MFMLTLEITKEINEGYIPEISTRRILKSSNKLLEKSSDIGNDKKNPQHNIYTEETVKIY